MKRSLPSVRIAMIASSLRQGGAEKQTVYFGRALRQAGFDLRFYYLGEGGRHESTLREAGIRVRQIHVPNGGGRMLVRLTGSLFRWRPHIVLVNQFGDLHFGALAGRLCGALVLGGVRSDGWYELRTYGRLSRLMFAAAHGFIANSHRGRHTLVSQGLTSSKAAVLPNVIDLRQFDACSAGGATPVRLPDGIIAVALGSLIPCKRHDLFLEALARARQSEPRLCGVIAGADGGVKAGLLKQAGDLGLRSEALLFAGECHDVPALLTRASMLVVSSDYEGFPNVILEAMAARLPVVTTDAGDAATVVWHGVTGYVVGCNDAGSLAGYMIRLAQSPALRTQLGQAGRTRAEQEYSYETLPDRLCATLRQFASPRLQRLLDTVNQREPIADQAAGSGGTIFVNHPA